MGSYFPAFFPDGALFFLSNTAPRESEGEKRFRFRVVDPASRGWRTKTLGSPEHASKWAELGLLWQRACTPSLPSLGVEPFPLEEHELPVQAMSLSARQCQALVEDARSEAGAGGMDWDALTGFCTAIER